MAGYRPHSLSSVQTKDVRIELDPLRLRFLKQRHSPAMGNAVPVHGHVNSGLLHPDEVSDGLHSAQGIEKAANVGGVVHGRPIITLCEGSQVSHTVVCQMSAPVHGFPMIDPPQIIGERLHRLRHAIELNQAAIAEILGITQSAWSQYENGTRRVTLDVAGNLASRFGVTLDWIYRGDPSGLPMKLAKELIL